MNKFDLLYEHIIFESEMNSAKTKEEKAEVILNKVKEKLPEDAPEEAKKALDSPEIKEKVAEKVEEKSDIIDAADAAGDVAAGAAGEGVKWLIGQIPNMVENCGNEKVEKWAKPIAIACKAAAPEAGKMAASGVKTLCHKAGEGIDSFVKSSKEKKEEKQSEQKKSDQEVQAEPEKTEK